MSLHREIDIHIDESGFEVCPIIHSHIARRRLTTACSRRPSQYQICMRKFAACLVRG